MDVPAATPPLSVAIGRTPAAAASVMFGIQDVLSAVGRAWQAVHEELGAPVFAPRLLTVDGLPFQAWNGIRVQPDGGLGGHPAPRVVIVPDLAIAPDAPLPDAYSEIADWIRIAHGNGALVCSVCTGTA